MDTKEIDVDLRKTDRSSAHPTGPALARNTILNVIGQLAPLLIGLATIPPVIRGLGVDRFGVLTLCWALLGYLAVFQLGIGPAVTKYAAELFGQGERGAASSLLASSIRLSAAMGVTAGVLLSALTPFLVGNVLRLPAELERETRIAFYILGLTMPFLFVSGAARGLLSAAQRFGALNAVWVVSTSLNYLIPLFAVLLGHGLAAILAAVCAGRVAATLVLLLLCRRTLLSMKEGGRREPVPVRTLLRFGGWVAVSSSMNPILSHLERFLIASLLSVGILTYYATPLEMISRVAVLPASLALTLFPAISYYGREKSNLVVALFERSFKWLFVLMVPVTVSLVALSETILTLWLGGDFGEKGTALFRLLAIAFFFHAFAYVPLSVVQGLGRPDLKAKLDLVEVPVYVTLLLLLIPWAGIGGAAVAKLIITLVDVAALFYFSTRLLPVQVGSFLGRRPRVVLGSAVLYGLGVLVLVLLRRDGAEIALGVAVLAALYFAVLWRYGLDEEDLDAIRSFAARLGGGRGRA